MSQPPAYGQPGLPQQPAYYYPPQAQPYGSVPQPPRKSPVGLIIGIVAGVLLLVCVVGAGAGWWFYNRTAAAGPASAPSLIYRDVRGDRAPTHTVQFLVAGSGQAKITWSNGDGDATETAVVSLPWQKVITVKGNNFRAFAIVAGAGSQQNVQLCEVFIDGSAAAHVPGDGMSVTCATRFIA